MTLFGSLNLYGFSLCKEKPFYTLSEKIGSVNNENANGKARNTRKKHYWQKNRRYFLTVMIGFFLCHEKIAFCIGKTVNFIT